MTHPEKQFKDVLPENVQEEIHFPLNYSLFDRFEQNKSDQHVFVFNVAKSARYRAEGMVCIRFYKPISKI